MGLKRNQKGPSFFDLLTSQANALVEAVALLSEMFAANKDSRPALRDKLHEVEHQADEYNHAVLNLLNQTFVTPFDREDLSFLASSLDDCMDFIDEAGDLLVLYGVDEVPEEIAGLMTKQVDVLSRSAEQTAAAMPGLKSPEDLRDYWVEINRLENEGDQAYRHTLSRLFESGLDPITIIKLKDIVTVLESAADAFEDLANAVEGLAVKES